MTILVDHDMGLVSSCCEVTAVLDFGKLPRRHRERARGAPAAEQPDGRGHQGPPARFRARRPEAGRPRALELFPELGKRLSSAARSRPDGEQQMVVLAQALVSSGIGVLLIAERAADLIRQPTGARAEMEPTR